MAYVKMCNRWNIHHSMTGLTRILRCKTFTSRYIQYSYRFPYQISSKSVKWFGRYHMRTNRWNMTYHYQKTLFQFYTYTSECLTRVLWTWIWDMDFSPDRCTGLADAWYLQFVGSKLHRSVTQTAACSSVGWIPTLPPLCNSHKDHILISSRREHQFYERQTPCL
jgi:hypothetical protein